MQIINPTGPGSGGEPGLDLLSASVVGSQDQNPIPVKLPLQVTQIPDPDWNVNLRPIQVFHLPGKAFAHQPQEAVSGIICINQAFVDRALGSSLLST